MSNRFCCISLVLIAITSCKEHLNNEGLKGTFVKYSSSSFSRAWDTIRILPDEELENTFHVLRNTGYQRIVADTLQAKRSRQETFMMQFDKDKQLLHDTHREHVFFVHPTGDTIYDRRSAYYKID